MKGDIRVVDLFCGIGGLTHGLQKAGLEVVAGIDNDETCKFGYEYNNGAKFVLKDILDVSADELRALFGNAKNTIRVLAGCAPCQPFSRLNPRAVSQEQLAPLEKFAQLIGELLPEIVTMENVRGLANRKKYPVFDSFIKTLENNGYEHKYEVVDVSEYGVPQSRHRIVLLASRLGNISLIERTHEKGAATVRKAIGKLDPIADGEVHSKDLLHRASKLSSINKRRVRATPHDGGDSHSWSEELLPDCYRRDSGKTYRGTVYGRMRWDAPAPTMTTQCIGLGNGRFGHPEQDRAISLREAAIFQTFPKSYQFTPPHAQLPTGQVARHIGNAVPVKLATVIGKSIKQHLQDVG